MTTRSIAVGIFPVRLSNNDSDLTSGEEIEISRGDEMERSSTLEGGHRGSVDESEDINSDEILPPLTSSTRLKGYFALSVFSCLAFTAAYESDLKHNLANTWLGLGFGNSIDGNLFLAFTPLPSNESGRYYAIVVSGVSAASNIFITLLHYLDFFELALLRKIFRPGSFIECAILVFGIIWWAVAIGIITTIRGPGTLCFHNV